MGRSKEFRVDASTRRIDPFVFVAATRYAIRRYFTDASDLICRQVALHAETIKEERGAVSAILREIEDFDRDEVEPMSGVSLSELGSIKMRWLWAGDQLR